MYLAIGDLAYRNIGKRRNAMIAMQCNKLFLFLWVDAIYPGYLLLVPDI